MSPTEVLSMSLPQLNAYMIGYSDHIFDLEVLAVKSGFWSAYFSGSNSKSLDSILKRMLKQHEEAKKQMANPATNSNKNDETAMEDLVAEFEKRDKAFKRKAELFGTERE